VDDTHRSALMACTLGPGDQAGRAARWKVLTERSLARAARTEHGVSLTFRPDPGVAEELRDLAALERDCCAFAAWSVHEHGAGLTLEVAGDTTDAVAAVRSLFPALT